MRTLELNDVEAVAGGQPSLSNVVAVVGFGIAIATAPGWAAIGACVGLIALGVATLEN
jgi:hypothetical protein